MIEHERRKSSRLPLSALLSQILIAHAQDAESAWTKREMPPLALWANVLRPIGAARLEQRDLPAAARLSKRAVRSGLQAASTGGWVDLPASARVTRLTVADPKAGAASRLSLSARGRKAHKLWEQRVQATENEWRARFGTDVIEELRRALETIVGKFDLELPHYPESYAGSLDPSIAGMGRWGRPYALRKAGLPGFEYDFDAEQLKADKWEEETGGKLYVGDHGQDWRPVKRDNPAAVNALPLIALLSQAMIGITIDYEGSGGISLAVACNFLRFVDDNGFRVEAQSRRAYDGLERHEYAVVEPDQSEPGGFTFLLTPKGKRVRDAYEPVLAAVEARWRRRYGTSNVRTLRTSLDAIVRKLDGDLPHHPL